MPPTLNLRLTPKRTFEAVLVLRGAAVLMQLGAVLLALYVLDMQLPTDRLLLGVGALILACAVGVWRWYRDWPISELEVALHLGFDIVLLTWQLYHAGGSSNPFVSAYLVPIALAAIALQPRYSVAITALCIAAYSLLLRYYLPLGHEHHAPDGAFALHVFGMWVNFVISACLIAALLWVMRENVRRRDRIIAHSREEVLRNEHVIALGALAAGAAHELSTPLSTVGLIADELTAELGDKTPYRDDLQLLQQQIQQCKASLSTLLASAGRARLETSQPMPASAFLAQTIDRWQLLRPEMHVNLSAASGPDVKLLPEQGLAQALINLLNNAADASLAAGEAVVNVQAQVEDDYWIIEIEDRGRGMSDQARALAGRAVFSTKPDGAGIGLLLTHTTLNRWGGSLSLHRRTAGGTLSRISLPLDRLGAMP